MNFQQFSDLIHQSLPGVVGVMLVALTLIGLREIFKETISAFNPKTKLN